MRDAASPACMFRVEEKAARVESREEELVAAGALERRGIEVRLLKGDDVGLLKP